MSPQEFLKKYKYDKALVKYIFYYSVKILKNVNIKYLFSCISEILRYTKFIINVLDTSHWPVKWTLKIIAFIARIYSWIVACFIEKINKNIN